MQIIKSLAKYRQYAVFTVSLVTLLAGLAYFGVMVSSDYGRYVWRGGEIWEFILSAGTSPLTKDLWTFLYIVPNMIIGGGHMLIGESFPPVCVLMNIVLYSLMAVGMFKLWLLTADGDIPFLKMATGWAILFGLPMDVLPNVYWALSDVLFMFIVSMGLLCLGMALLGESDKRWWWVGCLGMSIAAFFTRPSGLVMLGFVAIAWVVSRFWAIKATRWLLVLVVVAPVMFALLFWPYVMYDGWEVSFYPPYIAGLYSDGVVVVDRPETYLTNPTSYFDFIAIAVSRFVYYLIPLRSAYSNIHNIYLLVYMAFLILMIIRSFKVLGSSGVGGEVLRFLLPLLVLYYALFHSLFFVEDFRYQLPAVVAFWALAGFGAVGEIRNYGERVQIKNKQPATSPEC